MNYLVELVNNTTRLTPSGTREYYTFFLGPTGYLKSLDTWREKWMQFICHYFICPHYFPPFIFIFQSSIHVISTSFLNELLSL